MRSSLMFTVALLSALLRIGSFIVGIANFSSYATARSRSKPRASSYPPQAGTPSAKPSNGWNARSAAEELRAALATEARGSPLADALQLSPAGAS